MQDCTIYTLLFSAIGSKQGFECVVLQGGYGNVIQAEGNAVTYLKRRKNGGSIMIFKQRFVENPYEKLVECIKRDLILNLQRKGIDIFKLDIDMKSDKVNVSLHIKEKQ